MFDYGYGSSMLMTVGNSAYFTVGRIMNFLLIYLWDTLGDYPDHEPISIPLWGNPAMTAKTIVEIVSRELTNGGYGKLGEFIFIDNVETFYSDDNSIIWNNSKMVKTFYWHLLSQNVRNGYLKVFLDNN